MMQNDLKYGKISCGIIGYLREKFTYFYVGGGDKNSTFSMNILPCLSKRNCTNSEMSEFSVNGPLLEVKVGLFSLTVGQLYKEERAKKNLVWHPFLGLFRPLFNSALINVVVVVVVVETRLFNGRK